MADLPLPNIPYRATMLDENGFLTQAWAAFFRELYTRVGGPVALTNIELEDLNGGSNLQTEVDALEVTVSSNQTTLQAQIDGLNQGTVL